MVAIASERFAGQVSTVHIDDFRASRELTAYLIGMGHTRIGYIKGDPNQADSARRYEGFLAAMKEAGIAQRRYLVQQGYFTYRSGSSPARSCWRCGSDPPPSSRPTTTWPPAVISAAHRQGLIVPRDLSVVGFDDSSAATMVWPELTTVRQPTAAMADQAIDLLRCRHPRQGDEGSRVGGSCGRSCAVKRDSAIAPLPPFILQTV